MTTPYLFPFNTFLLYRFIGWLVYRFIGWLEENPKPFFHWNFLDINFLNNKNSSYSYHRFHLKEKEGERERERVCVFGVVSCHHRCQSQQNVQLSSRSIKFRSFPFQSQAELWGFGLSSRPIKIWSFQRRRHSHAKLWFDFRVVQFT